MIYKFEISDDSQQSRSIIKMLSCLSKDYEFIKMIKTEGEKLVLTNEQEEELDRRYEMFLKNPKRGKSWHEVKQSLLHK